MFPGLHVEDEPVHDGRAFRVMGFQKLVSAVEDVNFHGIERAVAGHDLVRLASEEGI